MSTADPGPGPDAMVHTHALPGSLTIVVETERTIQALQPIPLELAALVNLARQYAQGIAAADASNNSLKELGPKLASVIGTLVSECRLARQNGGARPGAPSAAGGGPVGAGPQLRPGQPGQPQSKLEVLRGGRAG